MLTLEFFNIIGVRNSEEAMVVLGLLLVFCIISYVITTFTGYLTFGSDTGNQLSLNFSGWIGYSIQIAIFINGYSR